MSLKKRIEAMIISGPPSITSYGLNPRNVIGSGNVGSDPRDSPSSSGPGSITSIPKGAVINHQLPEQHKPDNSRSRPLTLPGPESPALPMILRTPETQTQQKKKKKSNILKKLFGCCFPFIWKKKIPAEEDIPAVYIDSGDRVLINGQPIVNKHLTRAKYASDYRPTPYPAHNSWSERHDSYLRERLERKERLLEGKGFVAKRDIDGVIRYNTPFQKQDNCKPLKVKSGSNREPIKQMADKKWDPINKELKSETNIMKVQSLADKHSSHKEQTLNKNQRSNKTEAINKKLLDHSHPLQPLAGGLISNEIKIKRNVLAQNVNQSKAKLNEMAVIIEKSKRSAEVHECQHKPNDLRINSVAADKITAQMTEMADTVDQDIRSKVIDTQNVDKQSKTVENNQQMVSHKQNKPLKSVAQLIEEVLENKNKADNKTHSVDVQKTANDDQTQKFENCPKEDEPSLQNKCENNSKVDEIIAKVKETNPEINEQMLEIIANSVPTLTTNHIVLKEYLGGGSFGVVFSADMANKEIAIKFSGESGLDKIIRIMSRLKHKNVVTIYDLKDNITNVMAMDVGAYDLRDFMKTNAKKDRLLAFPTIRVLTKNIVEGVHYLHSKGFTHNDLKPDNILVIRAHDHHFAAKVADFDFIQNCYDDNRVLLKRRGVCATPAYRSPEVLEKILIDDTRAPDVYAIGVVFYMLLTFHRPFPQYDYKDENVVKQRIEDIRKSFDGMFDLMPNVDHNSKAIDGFVRVSTKTLESGL